MGRRLRRRPLHGQRRRASAPTRRPTFEATAALAGLAAATDRVRLGSPRARQHLPAPGGARQLGRDGRPHQRRSAAARHRRRVAGERARAVRHRAAAARRADRPLRGGLPRAQGPARARSAPRWAGAHYQLADAVAEPKPVQHPLPLLIGGKGDRMLGVVARHADEWNMWGLADAIAERSAVLERRCEAVGRDPAHDQATRPRRSCGSPTTAPQADAFLAGTGGRAAIAGTTDDVVADGRGLAGGRPRRGDRPRLHARSRYRPSSIGWTRSSRPSAGVRRSLGSSDQHDRENAMPTNAEVRAQLTGPGGMFEITTDDVLGRPTEVYASRMPSLRSVAEVGLMRGDDQTFIVYGDRTYGFGTFVQTANGVAHALRDRFGLAKGDRVAVLSQNNPEWCLTFWATVSAGRHPRRPQRLVDDRRDRLRPAGLRAPRSSWPTGSASSASPARSTRRPTSSTCSSSTARPPTSAWPTTPASTSFDELTGSPTADVRRRGDRRGRPRGDLLHVGHHGPPEGRHLHPPQHDRQPAEHDVQRGRRHR